MGFEGKRITTIPLAGEYLRWLNVGSEARTVEVYPDVEAGLPDPPYWVLLGRDDSFLIIHVTAAGSLYRSRLLRGETEARRMWGYLAFDAVR